MIVVEDGTGIANAVSYVSVEDATAYHTIYGNTVWTDNVEKQESSLARATQMIDMLWGPKFISRKATKGQALQFPRLGFYDNNAIHVDGDEIPKCLKDAVCELAVLFITDGELIVTDGDVNVKRRKQKVGDLEEEVEYQGTDYKKQYAERYNKIDLLLQAIVSQPNFGITL